MKTWLKKYEWTAYAACAGSELHTAEYGSPQTGCSDDVPGFELNEQGLEDARRLCRLCSVRPECIEWALREKACGVIVAGVYLPDLMYKKALKSVYEELESSLEYEKRSRGDV